MKKAVTMAHLKLGDSHCIQQSHIKMFIHKKRMLSLTLKKKKKKAKMVGEGENRFATHFIPMTFTIYL